MILIKKETASSVKKNLLSIKAEKGDVWYLRDPREPENIGWTLIGAYSKLEKLVDLKSIKTSSGKTLAPHVLLFENIPLL